MKHFSVRRHRPSLEVHTISSNKGGSTWINTLLLIYNTVRAEPFPSRWVPSPGLSLTCVSVSANSVGRAEYVCFNLY